MAKVLITPIKSSGIKPFELTGELTSKYFDEDGLIYYINDRSFPANIVTILESEESESA